MSSPALARLAAAGDCLRCCDCGWKITYLGTTSDGGPNSDAEAPCPDCPVGQRVRAALVDYVRAKPTPSDPDDVPF